MHVAMVIYGNLEEVSGGFLYDRQLVDGLQQRGHHVTVVATPWRSYGRSLADNLSLILLRTLQNRALDLIVQDELVHPSYVLLNRRLRRTVRTPLIALIHLLRSSQPWGAWQRRLYTQVEYQYLTSVDGFIFVNRHIAARVHRLLQANPPGVIANPAGDHFRVDTTPAQLTCRAQRPGPLRLIFVGNLTPLKGLHLLLDALQHVPATGWRLTVIGSLDRDRAYVRRLRQQIAASGWQDKVTLLGMRPHAEVNTHLAQSDLFALPSHPESYSIAYLEALSHGLPVIAHAHSDSADLVEPGVSGFHVYPDNMPSLATQLHALATDRQQLVPMCLAARQRFLQLPTWNQSMHHAVQFLEDMVAHARA